MFILLYFSYKRNETPLHCAAESGNLEIFKYIAEQLEDKSPVDDIGGTPLDCAAYWGHLEVVKYELNHSENKNPTKMTDGCTKLPSFANIL